MIIRRRAYARAGLVGNPSDGYHGKTMAFTVRNFWAEATIYESPEVELKPGQQDHTVFESFAHLLDSVRRHGYYGGIRLLKASAKKFAEYSQAEGMDLPVRNFTLRYTSNIPRQVGLGGSSAIITAAIRAMSDFYGVEIPVHILPNVVLAAETDELQLSAGLQDRVVQAYEGLVYMDFSRDLMEQHGHGHYEALDPALLPPVYVAYRRGLSEESDQAHIKVRERYELGDREVIATMNRIADLADEARQKLLERDHAGFAAVLNRNFDLRRSIYPISEANLRIVELARATGASCKFCGSSGSVVGTYEHGAMLEELRDALGEAGCEMILPDMHRQDALDPADYGGDPVAS